MRSFRSVLRLLLFGLAGVLLSSRLSAAPAISGVECLAVQLPNSTSAGTENTWYIFRATIDPGSDTAMVMSRRLIFSGNDQALDLSDSLNPMGVAFAVNLVRDATRGGNNFVAVLQGKEFSSVTGQYSGGISRDRRQWAIHALESTDGTISGTATSGGYVEVWPSVARGNMFGMLIEPSVLITPVDAAGNDDTAPGVGQNGNGLRVDPEDTTRPNDGGGSHRFTWRVRVSTPSGMCPATLLAPEAYETMNYSTDRFATRWQNSLTGVYLVLIDPAGKYRICPMMPTNGSTGSQIYPYISNNSIQTPQGSANYSAGVVYQYVMEPTQFLPIPLGGDLQSMVPQFTIPDGLPSQFLGGGSTALATELNVGRPYANMYAAFGDLDPTLQGILPPPTLPVYASTVGRAGQWKYFYVSSVDFRSVTDPRDTAAKRNFVLAGGLNNAAITSYRDNFGADVTTDGLAKKQGTEYHILQKSDDARPLASAMPYIHPYVTPIMTDGHWTDDLLENKSLQLPPGGSSNYTGEATPPYDDPSTSVAANARRSRVTIKTKVRFQCRVTHVPKAGVSGALTVRVWIGTALDGSLQPHMMQVAPNQGALDYNKGVIYYFDTVFGSGQEGRKAMYFEADDGVNRAIWPRRPTDDNQAAGLPNRTDAAFFGSVNVVGDNYVLEPWVNSRPTLTDGKVTPSSGVVGQSYTYEVTYRDADNDPPMDAWVIVNNDPVNHRYRMTESPEDATKSYTEGRRYRLILNQLPGAALGKYNFYFQFRDNWAYTNRPIRREFGEWVTYPQGDDNGNPTTVNDGPTITTNNSPELREVSISAIDTAYNTATQYDFFVRYRDADSNGPTSLKLFVELYDQATGGRIATDPGKSLVPAESGTNYASGVQYHLPAMIRLASAPAGQEYRYRFETSDGIDPNGLVTVGTGSSSMTYKSWRQLRSIGGDVFDDPSGTRAWASDSTLFIWVVGSTGTTTLLGAGGFALDSAKGQITIPGLASGSTVWASYRYDETVGPIVGANNMPVLGLIDDKDKASNYLTISQTVGSPTTSFKFTVDYSDLDNQRPLLDDGVTEGLYVVVDQSTKIALSRDPSTPLPVDYRTKVRYFGSSTLPIGNHAYHFEASDGAGSSRRPLLAADVDGNGDAIPAELPVSVVSTGSLTNLTIVPLPKGRSDQLYEFTCTYQNTDDKAPASDVELWVKSSTDDTYTYSKMSAIDAINPGSYRTGVRFRLQLTAPAAPLNPGIHAISVGFQADHAKNWVPFQDLTVNDRPVLSDMLVRFDKNVPPDATTGTQAQDVIFSVKYTDSILGDTPKFVNLVLADDPALSIPAPTTVPASPVTGDYKAGVVYTWVLPGKVFAASATARHFQFQAADDTENADAQPNPAGTFTVVAPAVLALTEASVTPARGNSLATFVYSVKYSHGNGIAPYNIKVTVDPGTANPVSHTLTPKAGDALDYVSGVVYETVPVVVASGTHTFQFEADDRFQTVTVDGTGPQVNWAPKLSTVQVLVEGDPTVHTVGASGGFEPPIVQNVLKEYRFRVTYTDTDGVPPAADGYVRLHMSGEATPLVMAPAPGDALNYVAGVVYEYVLPKPAPAGVKTLHFEAFDGNGGFGDYARYPVAGEIGGLQIRNIPVLSAPTPGSVGDNDGTLSPVWSVRSAQYTYRVKYAHADGAVPTYLRLKIDPGTATERTIAMQPEAAGPVDYVAGVLYSYKTAAGDNPEGQHTYRFETTDSTTDAYLPSETTVLQGPKVNWAPSLAAVQVFVEGDATAHTVGANGLLTPPIVANLDHNFTFRVTYGDKDAVAPAADGYVRLLVSGQAAPLAMQPTAGDALNYGSGVVYEYVIAKPAPTGELTFSFEAYDGNATAGDTVRIPTSGTIGGLKITNIPTLSEPTPGNPADNNGTLSPLEGTRSTRYTYTVAYKHLDNTAPSTIQLLIDPGTAAEKKLALAPAGSAPYNYAAGITYAVTTAAFALKAGGHTYRFETTDGVTSTALPSATTTYSGPMVANAKAGLSSPEAGTLLPLAGPPSTDFTFSVMYANADGNAPQYVRVAIDGVAKDMTRVGAATDYSAGVLYQYKYRFAANETARSHTYQFKAQDALVAGESALPADSTLGGPTLNTAFYVNPVFAPLPATLGGTVTFTAKLDTNTVVGPTPVTVRLVESDGSGTTGSATAAADGAFSYTSGTLGQTGDWKVQVEWPGVAGVYDKATAEYPFKVIGVTVNVTANVLDLISLPLVPVSPDPSLTFGATDTSGSPLSITALNLAVWNPVIAPTGGYQYADNVRASGGQAYWAKPNQGVVLNPRGKLWSQSQAYSIPLTAGWNMVGSVYLQDIAWSAVQVKYQGQTLPIAQAGEIVRNYAWGFNSATGSYVLVQAGGALKSGRGYWVKAVKSCDLVLPAPTTKAASAQAVVNAAANALQVIARLGATMDTDNFLPLDAGAKPAYVEKPPYLAEHAVVSIVPTESVQMPADLQAGTGVIHAFDVTTAVADANVVVEFPSMASLGRRYQATLVDLATGARKSLAQSGSYTYNTGATAAPRQFVLVLSKAAANSSLLISAVHNTGRAAGSMSFSYSMSAQATVRAQIVSATGAVVRTLSSGRAAAQGANSLLWDTRDNRGIAVPAGSYLLKLTGTDDGGRSATAVLPVVLVR
jgi:hypothetical protein